MNPEFWKNKKVLIIGHTGFKGSWVALWLQNLGAYVWGYALPAPTDPSLFKMAHVADEMVSLTGDIRDFENVKLAISQSTPEIVIHMAAQSLLRYSYANPVETFATNVMGTVNVLEAVRLSEAVRVVVSVTSDKCYENRELDRGYHENDPMGGYDPYSSSKGCAELVTAAYRHSYFGAANGVSHDVALATARAGNVIGGGDWAKDRLIPDVMRAVMEYRHVAIRNPVAVRPWQHVLEPLDGYLTLAERLWEDGPEFSEGWNFGPDEHDTQPVSWIVERLTSQWGEDARWEVESAQHPHEASYLKLDSLKARTRLGWSPKLSLETALGWVVEWYKGYQKNLDMRKFTHHQITNYQNIA